MSHISIQNNKFNLPLPEMYCNLPMNQTIATYPFAMIMCCMPFIPCSLSCFQNSSTPIIMTFLSFTALSISPFMFLYSHRTVHKYLISITGTNQIVHTVVPCTHLYLKHPDNAKRREGKNQRHGRGYVAKQFQICTVNGS